MSPFWFQVYNLLTDVDPNFIEKFIPRMDFLGLNCFPVTPNCHRVTEFTHAFSNGNRLSFVSVYFFSPFSHSLIFISCHI